MTRCRFDQMGCRNEQCRFDHENARGVSSKRGRGGDWTRGEASDRGRGRGRGWNSSGAPFGECVNYFETGQCTKGSACRFSHLTIKGSPSPMTTSATFQIEAAKFNNLNSDWIRGPITTTNREGPFKVLLERLLKKEIYFGPRDTLTFVNGFLASSMIDGLTYSMEDAQHVFGLLSKPGGAGLGKLRDIISATNVTTTQQLSFQRVFLPILLYLSSEVTRNPPSNKQVNAIYTVLDQNADEWISTSLRSLRELMRRKSLVSIGAGSSGQQFDPDSFLQVFVPLIIVLSRYLTRIVTAVIENPIILELIAELKNSFDVFRNDMLSTQPTFIDSLTKASMEDRRFLLLETRNLFNKVDELVSRSQGKRFVCQDSALASVGVTGPSIGVRRRFQLSSQPPGSLRATGPRHDNDFDSIRDIQTLPTQEELLSDEANFVPGQFKDAPHHLEAGSMERQLDIHYRLLREDSISPLCSSIKSLILEPRNKNSRLDIFLARGGGRWRSNAKEGVDLQLYAQPSIISIGFPEGPDQHQRPDDPRKPRRSNEDLSIELHVRMPPKFESNGQTKLLNQGAVVGLVLFTDGEPACFLGTVSSKFPTTLASEESFGARRCSVRVVFFESEVYFRAITALASRTNAVPFKSFFFEVWKFRLNTLDPFLSALQKVEPTSIPFSHHLATSGISPSPSPSIPPRFARVPGFTYDLSSLLNRDAALSVLRLDAQDPLSIAACRRTLPIHSTMDESQSSALVDGLTRDLALISGPPGTGKSFIGVKMVEALLKNKIGPILIVTTTNHALDSFLESILDSGVTDKVIRCGSQSTSERIQPYSLREATAKKSGGAAGQALYDLRNRKEELEKHLEWIAYVASCMSRSNFIWSEEASESIYSETPELHESITTPPSLLLMLYDQVQAEAEEEEGELWEVVTRAAPRKAKDFPPPSVDPVAWWLSSSDLSFLSIYQYGFVEPKQDRPLSVLLEAEDVWNFSLLERQKLVEHWRLDILRKEGPRIVELRRRLVEVKEELAALQDKDRLAVLTSGIDIIACTTNGAANILALLSGARPRVLLVEEACEVLEAHLLAVLVPSIESCIQIGDPLQLRPSINSYNLSIDSPDGQLFRADESLFERLVNSGAPMSQLHTQRRMRPEISSPIRNYLYPQLVDHENVKNYPHIRGMREDVYFISHAHSEDHISKEQSSKTNRNEAWMVIDLAKHLIRNGLKDIAIITAYTGQLLVLKNLLATLELNVEVNELDKEKLEEEMEVELEESGTGTAATARPAFEKKTGKELVRLSSVDAFQGLEAEIILLSLVRNVSTVADEDGSVAFDPRARASIGFLKSPNRTNVAISRAKHGMYIFGNATLLSDSAPMWKSVVTELESRRAVGPVAPFCCSTHPEVIFEESVIAKLGGIDLVSPEGGCLADCDASLDCGHLCKRRCHPLDRTHATNTCIEVVKDVELPCGHVLASAACHLISSGRIECQVNVSSFLACGHSIDHRCYVDAESIVCRAPCSILLPDCNHPCRGRCGREHPGCSIPTEVVLPCSHSTTAACHLTKSKDSIICTEKVTSTLPCGHSLLHTCSVPLKSLKCKERCDGPLSCSHAICKAPCASCRPGLPLSPSHRHSAHKCEKDLRCAHRCAGVCGSENHECECQSRCSRDCPHGSCQHQCSKSCPGCLNECIWKCSHVGSCLVSCSTPCIRLPCDEPCKKILSCGCSCPSICGETCELQVCKNHPRRAADLEDIVDLLMMTSLKEVDYSAQDLSGRTMTLSCRHTFTVETLDGLFELEKFYTKSIDGVWNGITDASASQVLACPNCRAPISLKNSLRYGRPLKIAQLSTQEQMIISRASSALQKIGEKLEVTPELSLDLGSLELPNNDDPAALRPRKDALSSNAGRGIVPTGAFSDITKYGLCKSVAKAWEGLLPLLKDYNRLAMIIKKPSPATVAYQSSFTGLFNREMERISRAGGVVDERAAISYAERTIGSLPPRSDATIAIEAISLSVTIRSILFSQAQRLYERLSTLSVASNPLVYDFLSDPDETISQHERAKMEMVKMERFAGFIIDSITKDLETQITIATESKSFKKVLQAELRLSKTEFRGLAFGIKAEITKTARKSTFDVQASCQRVMEKKEAIEARMDQNISIFRNSAEGNVDSMVSNDEFIKTDIIPSINLLKRDFEGLIKFIKDEPFYEAVTEEERIAIVRAMKGGTRVGLYSGAARWYKCMNGHHFAVGDCGQLNQSARCPECGAVIGGQNSHSSRNLTGQRVDDEFGRV